MSSGTGPRCPHSDRVGPGGPQHQPPAEGRSGTPAPQPRSSCQIKGILEPSRRYGGLGREPGRSPTKVPDISHSYRVRRGRSIRIEAWLQVLQPASVSVVPLHMLTRDCKLNNKLRYPTHTVALQVHADICLHKRSECELRHASLLR